MRHPLPLSSPCTLSLLALVVRLSSTTFPTDTVKREGEEREEREKREKREGQERDKREREERGRREREKRDQ